FDKGERQMDAEALAESCKAVVRIFEGRPREKGAYRGSAFLIGPGRLMTARHVVDPAKQPLFAEGPAFDGGIRRILQIEHHPRPDRDVSILTIPDAAKNHERVPWSATRPTIRAGLEIVLIGYGTIDGDVETKSVSCQGHQGYDDAVTLTMPVSKGMSGGAAVLDNVLAGVVWAFDPDGHRSFITPIDSLRALLTSHGFPPVSETGSPLHKKPKVDL